MRHPTLTKTARRAVIIAHRESERRNDAVVSLVDLLFGVLAAPRSSARNVLRALNVEPRAIRLALPRVRGTSADPAMIRRLSTDASRVIEVAFADAERSGEAYVNSRHLLIAIASMQTTDASRVLAAQGVDCASARDAVPKAPEPTGDAEDLYYEEDLPLEDEEPPPAFGDAGETSRERIDDAAWPPPIQGYLPRPNIDENSSRRDTITGGISGFLLMTFGTAFYLLGPLALIVLFFVYIGKRPSLAWGLAIGGAIGVACVGICLVNLSS